jgi:hypothetical protein
MRSCKRTQRRVVRDGDAVSEPHSSAKVVEFRGTGIVKAAARCCDDTSPEEVVGGGVHFRVKYARPRPQAHVNSRESRLQTLTCSHGGHYFIHSRGSKSRGRQSGAR